MIRITYKDISFEREDEAKNLIEKYNLILFKDVDDVIVCYYSTGDIIESLWDELLTELALSFQANLEDEILSKNLLLVFCASDTVNIDLKKEIQSDTYCCRKIVRSNVGDVDKSIKELDFYNVEKVTVPGATSLKEILEKKHPEVIEMMRSENEI